MSEAKETVPCPKCGKRMPKQLPSTLCGEAFEVPCSRCSLSEVDAASGTDFADGLSVEGD